MLIEPDGCPVTHKHVCGASRFSILDGPCRENPIGKRFWESRSAAANAIGPNFRAVSLNLHNREGYFRAMVGLSATHINPVQSPLG